MDLWGKGVKETTGRPTAAKLKKLGLGDLIHKTGAVSDERIN